MVTLNAALVTPEGASASRPLATILSGAHVSPKDFGAAGDGTSDDSAAWLACLNSGARVIDGGGRTYRLESNITPTCENVVVQNAVFDVSGVTGGGSAIAFVGAVGSGVSLTADSLKGSPSVAVANTAAFSADGYAWLSSDTVFDATTAASLGQIVKVKTVDSSTSLTLYDDVLYDFTVSASAVISPLALKKEIVFKNCRFVGAGAGGQSALRFDKCHDVRVAECNFDYFDYSSVLVFRSVTSSVTACSMRYARAAGTSYGVCVANGSYGVNVQGCFGHDLRHLVTVGGSQGVNLFVKAADCHASAARDAGFDSHPAGDFIVFDGNTVEMVGGAAVDGIICQAPNCVISNNVIVGNVRTGIRHQIFTDVGEASTVITGNSIVATGGSAATDSAIYVEQSSGAVGAGGSSLNSVCITGNQIGGAIEQGIYVFASTGFIKNVSIVGNVLNSAASVVACYVRAAASYSIDGFAISGNVFRCSGSQNVLLFGTTSPNILNGTVSGNSIIGGSTGLHMVQSQNVVESGNYNSGTTKKIYVDTASSNISVDRKSSSIVTVTNATYTVPEQDEYLIANRAGTITLTLPTASSWPGRELTVKTVQAQAVDSASLNIVPIDGTAAGSSILPATDGAWAKLKSDGSNWIILQRG